MSRVSSFRLPNGDEPSLLACRPGGEQLHSFAEKRIKKFRGLTGSGLGHEGEKRAPLCQRFQSFHELIRALFLSLLDATRSRSSRWGRVRRCGPMNGYRSGRGDEPRSEHARTHPLLPSAPLTKDAHIRTASRALFFSFPISVTMSTKVPHSLSRLSPKVSTRETAPHQPIATEGGNIVRRRSATINIGCVWPK